MARATPLVADGALAYAGEQIAVGSAAWYAWLATASAFIFECASGRFTARKDSSGSGRGGGYWRAYRRRGGDRQTGPSLQSPVPSPHAVLATKLTPARTRAGLVARPRLMRQLDAGLDRPLTLISAPGVARERRAQSAESRAGSGWSRSTIGLAFARSR
jgi:hypothetical protein